MNTPPQGIPIVDPTSAPPQPPATILPSRPVRQADPDAAASGSDPGALKAVDGQQSQTDGQKPSVLIWIIPFGLLFGVILIIGYIGYEGCHGCARKGSAPLPVASAPVKAQPGSPVKAAANAATKIPAPAKTAIAPATQPMAASLQSWPAFTDRRNKPGDWKACGELLKKSQLYEPNLESMTPEEKCLVKALELDLAR